jgi:hypothetical protein
VEYAVEAALEIALTKSVSDAAGFAASADNADSRSVRLCPDVGEQPERLSCPNDRYSTYVLFFLRRECLRNPQDFLGESSVAARDASSFSRGAGFSPAASSIPVLSASAFFSLMARVIALPA